MIYWLKTNQVLTRPELAKLLGCHESRIIPRITLDRVGGLKKLLEVKNPPGKASKISPEILAGLQARLSEPIGFKSYGEIQNWLIEKYQVQLAYKTVHKIVRYKLKAKPKTGRPFSLESFEKNGKDSGSNYLSTETSIIIKLSSI